VSYKVSAEQFPVFAWLALILLVIDLLVIERKISWLKNVNFFSKTTKKPTEK
jgi:Ca-activated chloride channel family protein